MLNNCVGCAPVSSLAELKWALTIEPLQSATFLPNVPLNIPIFVAEVNSPSQLSVTTFVIPLTIDKLDSKGVLPNIVLECWNEVNIHSLWTEIVPDKKEW